MIDCYFSSECKNSDKTEERGENLSKVVMPRRQTDGRHTQTETQHASPCPILTLQHWENTKHNPLFFCQSSQTYSFRSISSIHNHQPRSSQPFQVPGRRGPDMPLPPHNRRANYKGSSNKWALCGVSKTHGGGGGKKVLFILPPPPPPILPTPPLPTIPPSTKTIWEALRSALQGRRERRDCETRVKGVETRRWAAHAITALV